MKKEIIKAWSAVLVIVMLALSLTACNFDSGVTGNFDSVVNGNHQTHDLFPEGYTGGFYHQPGANIEYWWVETYEECIEAIERLKANGSTFVDDTVLTYDGELFDCKYCFMITGVGSGTEEIKWGDDPFDRRATKVYVTCYAFFDDVTLDELNHSYVSRYEAYMVNSEANHILFSDEITFENATISEWIKKGHEHSYNKGYYKMYKKIYYGDESIISIVSEFYIKEGAEHELGMTDECIKALIESGKIIIINEK